MAKPKKAAKQGKPKEEDIRKAVKERYANLALTGTSCCGPKTDRMCNCEQLYPKADVISLPSEAIAVSAGCGNPTAIANLRSGMTVVDLGSGGGIDVFLSAKKVGQTGKAVGIDATPEMIWRARKTAKENGFTNVEFRLGEIEHMPLDGGIADVVISNCVINLSPDKEQVFKEAFRVLKPGGKIAVSDIVLLRDIPDELRNNMSAWSECVSGAISEKEYLGAIEKAGFEKIKVEERAIFTHEQVGEYLKSEDLPMDSMKAVREAMGQEGIDLSKLVASYKITALKPRE
jgi:SAM-dependent methyltransferase